VAVEPAPLEVRLPEPPPPRPATEPPAEITIVSAAPARAEAPLLAALRCLQEKRSPDEVLALLEPYDPADREVLRDLLRLAVRLGDRDAGRSTPAEMTVAVDQLESLTRSLRPRAALVLEKLCFCRPRSVDNFGVYEPLEDGHAFRAAAPGRPGERVQVYAEVRNFTSRPVGDHFETILKGTLEIHEKSISFPRNEEAKANVVVPSRPVVIFDLAPCTDRSRSPRQDFFVNLHFDVPARLLPGAYTLCVQVKDVTPSADSGKRPARVARRSLDFRVVGDDPPGGDH
jgi:hypothetical protein